MALLLVLGAALACTGPNPQYMANPCSMLGQRQCIADLSGQTFPAVCTQSNGQASLQQEACPKGAACMAGLCAPPADAKSCKGQHDCPQGQVCVPLVSGGELMQFCVSGQAGALPPGATCDNDVQCQSSMCLLYSAGAMLCPKICQTALDCNLITETCRPLTVTVTGVQGTISSCGPRRP